MNNCPTDDDNVNNWLEVREMLCVRVVMKLRRQKVFLRRRREVGAPVLSPWGPHGGWSGYFYRVQALLGPFLRLESRVRKIGINWVGWIIKERLVSVGLPCLTSALGAA